MAAAGSDPELWLDRHGDALYAFALLRVQQPALAEDLVQDTLLAALAGRADFSGAAQERTWLIGILKYKIIDHLRRAGREERFDPEAADAAEFAAEFDRSGHWVAPPTHRHDPAFMAENRELREALERCIAQLPDPQRQLFVLREIDGYATDELLDLLAISTAGNLWVMLSRARERMRCCLQASWSRGKHGHL